MLEALLLASTTSYAKAVRKARTNRVKARQVATTVPGAMNVPGARLCHCQSRVLPERLRPIMLRLSQTAPSANLGLNALVGPHHLHLADLVALRQQKDGQFLNLDRDAASFVSLARTNLPKGQPRASSVTAVFFVRRARRPHCHALAAHT